MEATLTLYRTGYSGLQIGLHWLIVAMVAVQLLIGESMTEMIEAAEEGEVASPEDVLWGNVHLWLGIAILVIMLVRLFLRLAQGAPQHAGDASPLTKLAAAALHGTLYVVLLAAPISGLVAYYRLADTGEVHGESRPILIVLVLLHALAAISNQFVRKDGTLSRMLRPQ